MKPTAEPALTPSQIRMMRANRHGGRATLTFRLSEEERTTINAAAEIENRQLHEARGYRWTPPHKLGEFVRTAALTRARAILEAAGSKGKPAKKKGAAK